MLRVINSRPVNKQALANDQKIKPDSVSMWVFSECNWFIEQYVANVCQLEYLPYEGNLKICSLIQIFFYIVEYLVKSLNSHTHFCHFMKGRWALRLPVGFGVKVYTINTGRELLIRDEIMNLPGFICHSSKTCLDQNLVF